MEVWKRIVGYPSYEVSSHGNVRRLLKSGKYRMLTPCDNGNGYMRLNLYRNSQQTKFYIHRLVAKTFLSNRQNLPEVHHKDHNKRNNILTNLQWVTSEENNSHKVVHYRQIKKVTRNGSITNP